MDNAKSGYFSILSDEDTILVRRISDWISISQNKFFARFSFFLDERQQTLAESYLKSLSFDDYVFYGGHEDAQRKILGIFPQYQKSKDDFPVRVLYFTFRECDEISHRDVLGSLMSLQIKRESVGDILISKGIAAVYLFDSIAELIYKSIAKIGSTGVKVSFEKTKEIIPIREFTEIKGTVASLRLDSIVAVALGISREKAHNLIVSGIINVNYFRIDNPASVIKFRDVFSIKGFGKFELDSLNGLTKKDRLHITIKKYI